MNAGSPIFDAFAMERVSAAERATLSAGMTMLWALGWTIAPLYYGVLHAQLSFTAAFAVDFVTIIVLYTIATALLWTWFRGTDRGPPRPRTRRGRWRLLRWLRKALRWSRGPELGAGCGRG